MHSTKLFGLKKNFEDEGSPDVCLMVSIAPQGLRFVKRARSASVHTDHDLKFLMARPRVRLVWYVGIGRMGRSFSACFF